MWVRFLLQCCLLIEHTKLSHTAVGDKLKRYQI